MKHKCVTSAVVLLSFVLSSATGCSRPKDNANDESLVKFAVRYRAFRSALLLVETVSWAIAVDQLGPAHDSTLYRESFVGALDTKTTNRSRATAAKKGLEYYQSKSTKVLDDFYKRNEDLDRESLALIEAANGIHNDAYRRQAVAVADSARSIERSFDALGKDYGDLYGLQVDLLNEVVAKGGDMYGTFGTLKAKLPEKQRLDGETQKLRDDAEASVQRLQEQYAAFKGMTGVSIDYAEPEANGTGPNN